MVVRIPKDIDATEAKIFKGLSLKKGVAAFAAAGVFVALFFGLHLPEIIVAPICGFILFLGFFQKGGMNAWTVTTRVLQTCFAPKAYTAEPVASANVLTKKQMEKAAEAWNKTLRMNKLIRSGKYDVKTVRCSSSRKTRK